jgi:carboxymethylenebutenolidase
MPEITIRAEDGGNFSGFLATPKNGKGPGIVVIQEIFGVNAVMREITEGLAGQGFIALCPDLFWRIKPGIQITDKTEAEWKQAFELFGKFNVGKGVDDLNATLAALRQHPACTGKVGAVGFCLGGKMAYLMATRTDVDCSVGYYAVGLAELTSEAKKISKPLTLHVANKDKFVPPDQQAVVKAALGGNPNITIHEYPNCDHAFARPGGEHYDKAAADQAGKRSLEFLRRNLSA